jgi:Putative transposase/Transposase zinc-binding domain
MPRPRLALADIFRQYGPDYRAKNLLPLSHRRVMRAVETCRTAVLGGHVESCGHCDHQRIAYNSCRNRHCPKCQSTAKERWIEQRKTELLPIAYFHAVFTVPPAIADIALRNRKTLFGILFRASAETLLRIAADPKHLGASIGFFSILHTWGQNLLFHPHVHCVVTGGGIPPCGKHWVHSRPRFLVSVRVLSRLFRRLFLQALEEAYRNGELEFHQGVLASLSDPESFRQYLQPLRHTEWVVYMKPPFGSAEHVIDYLGRYTHRVAIGEQRLLSQQNGQVSFLYKDYRSADPQQQRTMTLSADEFIRRFLLHVLPGGFQRIRYYGLFGNRHRVRNLALCRALLVGTRPALLPLKTQLRVIDIIVRTAARCPVCKIGAMARTLLLPSQLWKPRSPDTS